MEAILSIKQLSVVCGQGSQRRHAISRLNLELQRGRCMGLVGESGSGKSMTALAIMQLLPNTVEVSQTSIIHYHQRNLLQCSEQQMRELRGKKIAMIFQDALSAFNPVLTIGQQLGEIIRNSFHLTRQRTINLALDLLVKVGISNPKHCLAAYPHQLSGGMRQRAMIAMALAGDPEIIIADEPTTALDVTIQAQVMALLQQLKEEEQLTLLFITHDLGVVAKLADDITVLCQGQCVEQTTIQQFFHHPQHAYSQQLLAAVPSHHAQQKAKSHLKHCMSVKQLKVYYPIKKGLFKRQVGVVKAVDNISFHIGQGETMALVGESGSGKTTTAWATLQLIKRNSGSIYFQERDVSQLSRRQLRRQRQHWQIIFQDPYAALNPRLMIADSIAEAMITQKTLKKRQQQLTKIDQLLTQVGLDPAMKWRYPHAFSGGERQRICIARALALSPQLLILDEPTSALDVSIQMQILDLLLALQQEQKISYLLITHNLAVVAYLAHRVAVMRHGKIVEQGETSQLLVNPQHDYTRQLLESLPTLPQT